MASLARQLRIWPSDLEQSIRLVLTQNKDLGCMTDAILRTALADLKMGSRRRELIAMIQSVGADDCASAVHAVLKELPELKENLRPGATDLLQSVLAKFLREKTAQVLTTTDDAEERAPAVDELDALMDGLTFCQKVEGCLDDLVRLKKWIQQNQAAIGEQSFVDYLKALAGNASKMEVDSISMVDFSELKAKVQGCPNELNEEVNQLLIKSMPLLLRSVKCQARGLKSDPYCFRFIEFESLSSQ